MHTKIHIQNLKCGGCAHTIKTRLEGINGVAHVEVDNNEHMVSIDHDNETQLRAVATLLSSLGYPVEGEVNTLSKKAKSFVSCAVGRIKS